jgi:hypothetical protein
MLEHVPISRFNKKDDRHGALASLGEQAHNETARGRVKQNTVAKLEAIAADVFGIDSDELHVLVQEAAKLVPSGKRYEDLFGEIDGA